MDTRSLTIVLPAYNEEVRLPSALDELFAYLEASSALPAGLRVLVVDDGSTDRTSAIVGEYANSVGDGRTARLELLSVPHGGKGAAVRAGMLASDSDLAIFADADMATPPDQIPLLLEALETADLGLGSRIQPDGTDLRASQPPFRRVLGRLFHWLVSALVVGDVQDTQCGFKGFTREAAHDLFSRQQITSIVFDVEIIHLARKRGYRIGIVPISWNDRRGSRMHPSVALGLRVAWDLFRIPLMHRSTRAVRRSRAAAVPNDPDR